MKTTCERTGRHARAMEIDSVYCDTIVRRWEAFTGDRTVHMESGKLFAELAEQRTQTPPVITPAKGVNHD